MTEQVMSMQGVQLFLQNAIRTKRVKVREAGRVITIEQIEESESEKKYSCPFLGIAAESKLTVDGFLRLKQEERGLEYEQELRS